mgnify:CR=1 FL=1
MYPEIFVKLNNVLDKIGLSTFSILVGIGIVVMLSYIINSFEKKHNYSRKATNKFLIFLAISLAVTYGFASFFDAFFHFLDDGVFEGGITFIAGFIGGIVCFVLLIYIFLPEERKNIMNILNIIIPGVVLAHAIGRLGCFSVGCCYGMPTDSIFGVYFPDGTNAYYDGIREHIHPTQLYESFFLFVLYFILNYVGKVKENKFACYLIGYGLFRFILERFFRGDNRGALLGFPPSEILSIFLVICGISLLGYKIVHQRKHHELLSEGQE